MTAADEQAIESVHPFGKLCYGGHFVRPVGCRLGMIREAVQRYLTQPFSKLPLCYERKDEIAVVRDVKCAANAYFPVPIRHLPPSFPGCASCMPGSCDRRGLR